MPEDSRVLRARHLCTQPPIASTPGSCSPERLGLDNITSQPWSEATCPCTTSWSAYFRFVKLFLLKKTRQSTRTGVTEARCLSAAGRTRIAVPKVPIPISNRMSKLSIPDFVQISKGVSDLSIPDFVQILCKDRQERRTHRISLNNRHICSILLLDFESVTEWFLKMCISNWITVRAKFWCDRCLLITKRPKAPSHCRYLIWVLCYISYVGLNGVQFCDCSSSCVYCDFELLRFVFSTLRSRSCFEFN